MKNLKLSVFLLTVPLLLAGCESVENKEGFFYSTFVRPMDWTLNTFGELFNGSYGLAIIAIILIIRLVLMPFMLKNLPQSSYNESENGFCPPANGGYPDTFKSSKNSGRKNDSSAGNNVALQRT